MRPTSHSVAVGAFVIGGLALFTVGLFMIADRRLLFEEKFEIYAEFSRLNGLENGATVRVAGLNAGEVVSIEFPPGPAQKFRVRMRVREDLHPIVRSDSIALIQTEGLLGNKILEISGGSESEPPAPPLSTIPSREPFDFADIMERLTEMAENVNSGVEKLRADLEDAFNRLRRTAQNADRHFDRIGEDLQAITASGKEVAQNINAIVASAKAGKGTVGKLLTDEELYTQAKMFTREAAATSQNLQKTSGHFKEIVADVEQSEIVPQAERVLQNLSALSEQLRGTVESLSGSENGGGMITDLRQTVADAREAMSDLAEDAEALKRNWFVRGFFKKRGFYDLDSLTYEEYREGRLPRKHLQERVWVHARELFEPSSDGPGELTQQGKERLDKIMADFLRYPRNSPIMVEGYASGPSMDQQYLDSHERAAQVKDYLVRKFHWDSGYVGVMPMGAVKSEGPDGKPWDGVSLVLFYKKPKGVAAANGLKR